MCEQTEINYLDGDVVWVKLGSYWWPGQVVDIGKLPEDIQTEFQKKPLIAAVKFFQEDSFEFVKNYQQIYNYNCTHKEEFIKKGLDKYRVKSKDGSNYMDKFPEDVRTAEILTDGDPDILLDERFNPKEKPDISGLFGEKKIIKRKRNRDEFIKKNDNDIRRRVTHTRFLQENDHEVRIRQQPKKLPTSANNNFPRGIYPCHVCGFTTTRVNIIICHLKNHRDNKNTKTTIKSKVKTNLLLKSKKNNTESPKTKYIRKSVPNKIKSDIGIEFGKRKYCKQIEKLSKKKKSDPELREKLLADWHVDTDEEESLFIEKSVDLKFTNLSNITQSYVENKNEKNILKTETDNSDSILLLQESNSLLQETENLTNLSILQDIPSNVNKMDVEQNDLKTLGNVSSLIKSKESLDLKKNSIDNLALKKKDDQKSRLSCFDFEEDDIPEPSISSVRKIPRNLNSKNLSIKKEIIKEFEMSQALKNIEENFKNDEISNINLKTNKSVTAEGKIEIVKDIKNSKLVVEDEVIEECINNKNLEKIIDECETHVEIVEIFEVEKIEEKNVMDIVEKKFQKNKTVKVNNENNITLKTQDDNGKIKIKIEAIVEDNNEPKEIKEIIKKTLQHKKNEIDLLNTDKLKEIKKDENIVYEKDVNNLNSQMFIKENNTCKVPVLKVQQSLNPLHNQELISKNFTLEVKDKNNLTIDSIFEINNSGQEILSNLKSDLEALSDDECKIDPSKHNLNFNVKKRRGRPRKNLMIVEDNFSDNEHVKSDDVKKKIEDDHKITELNLDRSYTARRRIPNRKYQSSSCLQKLSSGSSRVDKSVSESDDKSEKVKDKIKNEKEKKLTSSKINIKLIDTIQNWNSSINIIDNTNKETNIKKNNVTSGFKIKESIKKKDNLVSKNQSKDDITIYNNFSRDSENNKFDICTDNGNSLKKEKDIQGSAKNEIQDNINVEIIYPKKCQIKKFELSKMNMTENNSVKCLNIDLNKDLHYNLDKRQDFKKDFKKNKNIENETLLKFGEIDQFPQILKRVNSVTETIKNTLLLTKSVIVNEKSSNYHENNDTEKHVSDIKLKKSNFDDNQFDSFQDAFIKTLEIDNLSKKRNISEIHVLEKKNININDMKKIPVTEISTDENLNSQLKMTNSSITNKFDNIEVILANKKEEKIDKNNSVENNKNIIQSLNNSGLNNNSNNLMMSDNLSNKFKNFKKLDESENAILVSPSDMEIKIVPVKKREKPRIIENVTLKEPMILKTKIIEKHLPKIGKHKLDNDNFNDEVKNFSKTKIMKIETVISNGKNKSLAINDNNLNITKKIIKTLKSDDNLLVTDTRNQHVNSLQETASEVPCAEKYIQQSSQSLVDMDLDINSMPFVLSEDVLTPESIEKMPVLISSILPTKIPVTTTISTTVITPTKQMYNINQCFDSSKQVTDICQKKKSGTPTILKSKSKAKPTITSIKTIVPPLTSATYKGNYKVNMQAIKTTVANHKVPGKYVIVQTSGHQQAYSTHHKVAIPKSKSSGNAQIVQQGSKVVILTSPQSGQCGQKILPLNSISKALNSGKVQKIITSKHGQQVYTSVNSQSFVASKTITASTGDFTSPTKSKVDQKISNHKQLIAKSVLNQLPVSITKSSVLSGLSQGILAKDSIFTQMKASTLGGKTIVSSKTFITKDFPKQSVNISKNSSITQSPSSKAIINSQGIVSKGAILTPITGSQVKALAAKNVKGNKPQLNQHKIQSIEADKNSKATISSSFIKGNTNLKTSSNIMVSEKTEFKSIMLNKKDIKQGIQKPISMTTILSPSSIFTLQQKGTTTAVIDKKMIGLKNINCSTNSSKLHQKIITETFEESLILKPSDNIETTPLKTKIIEQQKQSVSVPISKINKNINQNLHQKNSNLTNSVMLLPSNINTSFPTTMLPLQSENNEKISKAEKIYEEISSKKEFSAQYIEENLIEPKVSVQPQIMALPTENNDGSQTYVLVTIDEQGHIIPLDNNALMSLDGTSNSDGSRIVYIDSNCISESDNVDNIVLRMDNGSLTNVQVPNTLESATPVVTEAVSSTETLTTNQDILAAALANTDFQHEIGITECSPSTSMTNLTQTNLINQTILQSTIIPPTDPISSPLVLETSLTLNQPIMTPLEVPSSINIQSNLTPVTSTTIVPTSISFPITEFTQDVSYIATSDSLLQKPSKSLDQIKESIKSTLLIDSVNLKISSNTQYTTESNLVEKIIDISESKSTSVSNASYSFSITKNELNKKLIQTPCMPAIDNNLNANNKFDSINTSAVIENNLSNYVTKTSEQPTQDLTENNSQQNKDNLQTISNKKITIQEIVLKTPEIILNNMQDDCVSSQESISSNIEQYEKQSVLQEGKCVKLNENLPSKYELENSFSNSQSKKSVIDQEKITVSRDKNIIFSRISDTLIQDESNNINLEEKTQSYEELLNVTNDITKVSSQSIKCNSLQKVEESLSYDIMQTDTNISSEHCLTQAYENLKNTANSYETLSDIDMNAPSQSFDEIIEINKKKTIIKKSTDNLEFSPQIYEVQKIEHLVKNMETENDVAESNSSSQSNDIGIDSIGTNLISSNHLTLNEDETASSSYVPETPENQERDQDQESAISTSSYEIPPCEELNIASSNAISDTSIQLDHSNINNNGVSSSSYTLNPNSSSTEIDVVPTSSYVDQIIVEQSVSTSYEIPISINTLEETTACNYTTDNLNKRHQTTSYYDTHHEDVTENYYESMCKQNSRLETNSEEKEAPRFYENNSINVASEGSQNYFNQDETTASYNNHDISPSYYDPRTEREANQSYYSSNDLNTSSQVVHHNIEVTQSFYEENSNEQRLHQQEESTPTYTDRYSLDYVPVTSSLDRHDFIENSVPTRSMDR